MSKEVEAAALNKNTALSLRSLAGGVLITVLTPFLPFLAWPMLMFDPLFPPQCAPGTPNCLFSGKALFATALGEILIYSLLTYLILKWRLRYLRKTSYLRDD
jgi:hypothetical protein